jgi:hypothetical protein
MELRSVPYGWFLYIQSLGCVANLRLVTAERQVDPEMLAPG